MKSSAMISFDNEFSKLDVSLLCHASLLINHKNKILRQFNITWPQYNILTILRASYPKSVNLMSISSQMIDPASNTSRLVEKLRQKGLVQRIENDFDRRKVDISITTKGIDVQIEAGRTIDAGTAKILSVLTVEEARIINKLLEKINEYPESVNVQ
jgi:DNA-binding MarR family transcriptional regulator